MRTALHRGLPWIVASGCAAWAAAAWLRDVAPSRRNAPHPAGARAADDVGAAQSAPALAPLRECLGRLEIAHALLHRSRSRPTSPAAAHDSERMAECLRDAAVREHVDQEVRSALERRASEDQAARSRARKEDAARAAVLLRDVIGLTQEQSDWVGEYVCATRDLRRLLTGETPGAPGAEPFEEVRRQREQVLRDVEEYLGPDRYARLRSVGGIGLLADVLDCR